MPTTSSSMLATQRKERMDAEKEESDEKTD
jgi:hypothetical protein